MLTDILIGVALFAFVVFITRKWPKERIIAYKCDICGDEIRYSGICEECQDLADEDTCRNQGD